MPRRSALRAEALCVDQGLAAVARRGVEVLPAGQGAVDGGPVGDRKERPATNCRLTTDERSEVFSVTSRLSPEKKHSLSSQLKAAICKARVAAEMSSSGVPPV